VDDEDSESGGILENGCWDDEAKFEAEVEGTSSTISKLGGSSLLSVEEGGLAWMVMERCSGRGIAERGCSIGLDLGVLLSLIKPATGRMTDFMVGQDVTKMRGECRR
jgi:hypothetical protein